MNRTLNQVSSISSLYEKRMKYKNECGCKLGSQFMAAAFVVSMFITISRYHFFSMKFLSHFPIVILITIGAAALGKVSGIFYAKYKYNHLSKQLSDHLTNIKMEEPSYAGNME